MLTLVLGTIVTIIFWVCAWGQLGIFGEYSFFPLWVGYILAVNGTCEILFRTSLLRRMRTSFILLFAFSIPMWWFFERLNSVLQNWHYEMNPVSDLRYLIEASVDFSTVVPAVLSTVFLFHRLLPIHVSVPLPAGATNPLGLFGCMVLGICFFWLMLEFPREAFPLAWVAPILILEPVAYLSGTPCLLRLLKKGEWSIPLSAMVATFFTGIWWELWNYYSFPRWYYTIPYVGCCKVFEMPILGYFGYPFFGLIVVSYTALLAAQFFKIDIINFIGNQKSIYPATQ